MLRIMPRLPMKKGGATCQIFLFATSIGREEENRFSCLHRRRSRGGVPRLLVDFHQLE